MSSQGGRVIRETRGRGYVVFERIYIDITGSSGAALLLSQAIAWSAKLGDEDGWFYRTQPQWTEDIGLSRREQETARQRLCDLGLLQEERRGVPARLFFRVDTDHLAEAIDGLTCTSLNGGKRQTRMAENAKQAWRKTPNYSYVEKEEINDPDSSPDGDRRGHSDTPAPRPRNPHWDALVAGVGIEVRSGQDRKRVGKVVAQLKADFDPEEIETACHVHNTDPHWRGLTISWESIGKNISTLLALAERRSSGRDGLVI